jgi:hypothetical protein
MKQHLILKFTHLPSKSTLGKITEAHMVRKYANAQKDAGQGYTPIDKLDLNELTNKLVKGSSIIAE